MEERKFRFDINEAVKVIKSGKQYSAHYKALMTLVSSSDNAVAYQPFSFGKQLPNIPNLKKKEFTVLSRGYFSTGYGECTSPLYLIAEKEEYERYTKVFYDVDREKNPLSVYIIGEEGLCSSEEEEGKLFAVYLSFESFDIDSEPSQADPEDLCIHGKKVGLEEVAPYPCNEGLKVYVLAELEEKGREIAKKAFRKYLEDRVREMGEEDE